MESRWDSLCLRVTEPSRGSWRDAAFKRDRTVFFGTDPNGIEIIQPRVARRGLPWERVIHKYQL